MPDGERPDTRSRVLAAALLCFVERGYDATTLRVIADGAGAAIGSVQHFFATKEAIRRTLLADAAAAVAAEFGDPVRGQDPDVVVGEIGERFIRVFTAHPLEVRFLARSLVEGDDTAAELFRGFVALARSQFAAADAEGILTPGLDVEWAALQVVISNLATALFEPMIDQVLDDPVSSPAGLRRWSQAQNALFSSTMRPGGGPPRRRSSGLQS